MKLETPIVRVFRGETWLTVYRSIAVSRSRGKQVDGSPRVFNMNLETLIVQVFRAETWLTVYRSIAVDIVFNS